MRLMYVFTFCYVGLFLFVIVNRFETNRLLAHLLMFLLLGVTAAAVLQELKLDSHGRLSTITFHTPAMRVHRPTTIDISSGHVGQILSPDRLGIRDFSCLCASISRD